MTTLTGAERSQGAPVVSARLQQGTFDHYYQVHRGPIFRALNLTLGDWDLAAEATDEAMARTYQKWRSVKRYANPPGWTYQVGLNWARNRISKRKREISGDPPENPTAPPDADPQLLAALAALDLSHRQVVVMKYFLQMTQPEIAETLGISEGTVKSRLSRGLDALRNTWGVTP